MDPAPIFILGSHKSGTSLLRNLFDGHSDLAVIPKEFHPFQVMGYWVVYSYSEQTPIFFAPDRIRSNAKELIHRFNTKGSSLADADLRGHFDELLFERELQSLEEANSPGERIQMLLDALYASLYGLPPDSERRILHKTVGLEEYALDLHRYFPQARFIHVVRDPYDQVVAWRRFQLMTSGTYPLMDRMMEAMRTSWYYLFRNRSLIPGYRTVRYEDLTQDPEGTMMELCDHLDIPFEKSLLTPSSMRRTWEGNSTSGKGFQGVQDRSVTERAKELYPFEQEWVNRFLENAMQHFSYSPQLSKGTIWKKAKGESVKRYFYNRFQLISTKDRTAFRIT